MDDGCFFDCSNTSPNLINCGAARVQTIRDCSRRRGDGLIDKLHGLDSIRCHKSCVSTYTSKHHLKRYITKKSNDSSPTETVVPPKRSRRLGTTIFNFKEHCVFCGEKALPLDPRHPDRWRKVYQCRTTGDYKQKILLSCDERNDDLANEVQVRLSGEVTDLHAADAQYHNDCYKRFMSHKNIEAAVRTKSSVFLQDDPALDALICEMEGKKSCVWNSIEIHEAYTNYGGSKLSRKNLISNLFSHFGHDLLKLSGAGVANIFVFRSEAPHLLKLTDASDEVDMTVIAKTIKEECCGKAANWDTYHTRLTQEDVTNACSDMILRLLAELSPKLDNTNTALLIEDNTNELIITAEHPIPISIINGQVRTQTNLHNTHEKADFIIVNQLVYLAARGASNISVVSDDTDVFVFLLYFYCKEKLTCEVFMQSPIACRRTVDIKATATKHSNIAEFLPGVHALSGCDTTSFLYGIGKATALKVLNSGKTLKLLGKQDVPMEDVVNEATLLMTTCYGSRCCKNTSETRHDSPYYQTLMWKSSLISEPPEDDDPVKYGCTKRNDKLFPVMLPENISPVPTEILQMIKCACSSMRACSTSRCSCASTQMSCSMFCGCHAEVDCNNVNTQSILSQEEEDELMTDDDLHNI
ncbi:hypothetical protein Pcinc_020193 [Petrolisthes cinctipes]|uniref:Tesmin/TSO1-like CXC domain-containing protein n=1 Tax=Petrolisthes cinctipes TaxID=88211 RepID=A0AAE1FIM8_PETCI|nr:hypothetical protein Pcinc_020193 [Petrolisthes cinctipes]